MPGHSLTAYSATLLTVVGIANLAMANIAGGLAFLAFALFLWEIRRRAINRMRRNEVAAGVVYDAEASGRTVIGFRPYAETWRSRRSSRSPPSFGRSRAGITSAS
jgi:hypothetical protein